MAGWIRPKPGDQCRGAVRDDLMSCPSYERVLRYFTFTHLPPHLAEVSRACHDLAHLMVQTLPPNHAEVTAGLRKLLEAKDCFVRAALEQPRE